MRILSLELHNFRCFTSFKLQFTNPITLIYGSNGTGKTSLLEALHYMSYLRSFKAISSKEMMRLNTPACTITAAVTSSSSDFAFDTLYAKITQTKRSIKLNEKSISSFKELHTIYKAITITEDDVMLIQGSPALRRSFIDQVLLLVNPSYAHLLKKYRHILRNRNALVSSYKVDYDSYLIWTKQLLSVSQDIEQQRIAILNQLQKTCWELMSTLNLSTHTLTLSYTPAINTIGYSDEYAFIQSNLQLFKKETFSKRSLFGAHLDDFTIIFQDLTSRNYASRGQQKLIVFLLKLAQLKLIGLKQEALYANSTSNFIPVAPPVAATLLIDDFMTDFDEARSDTLIHLISSLSSHVIFTCPTKSLLQSYLSTLNPEIIQIK